MIHYEDEHEYEEEDYNEERNIKVYEQEKAQYIQKFDLNNIWCTNCWDICFASKYRFPNNTMGFRGQWYLPKLRPYVKYLKNFRYQKNIHMCYKKISETDCTTLEKLFQESKRPDCTCVYNISICDNCKKHRVKDKCYSVDDVIEKMTRSSYNGLTFSLNPACDKYNRKTITIALSSLEDIQKFKDKILFTLKEDEIEDIMNMIYVLEEHFSNEYPFFTLYLPEIITQFEETIMTMNNGNFCETIARSKDYFYFFQR
jgi:ferredoxin